MMMSHNLTELDDLLDELSLSTSGKKAISPRNPSAEPASLNNLLEDLESSLSRKKSSLHESDKQTPYIVPKHAWQDNSNLNSVNGSLPPDSINSRTYSERPPVADQAEPQELDARSSTMVNSGERLSTASAASRDLDDLMTSLSDFRSNLAHQKARSKPANSTASVPQEQPSAETPGPPSLDEMMGQLQTDMDKRGIRTVQKGYCAACEKQIIGKVVAAIGKTWHPACFICSASQCTRELVHINFFERDGKPFCEPCYQSMFSPKCAYCNGAILESCVTALGKTWHPEHFLCATCGERFDDNTGYHERSGKAYCRKDYCELFAPKCMCCNQPILDNFVSALGGHWHPECFVCADCKNVFPNGSFFEHNGMPYCETHYHSNRGSLCAGCYKPITGRCITAMGKKFHPDHFICSFCLKTLNKGTFKEHESKPFCHVCFIKLFG